MDLKPSGIWKFPIPRAANTYGDFQIEMPLGANVLSVGVQGPAGDEIVCIWAAVDTAQASCPKDFCLRGTGHGLTGEEGRFIGTVFQDPYVWHLFCRKTA